MKSIEERIRTKPASMFMSGVEGQTYWDLVVKKAGCKNVLTSYHYFQKQKPDTLRKRLEANPDVNVFIDSGAFTFFSQDPPPKKEEIEDYLDKYTTWAKANKEYIFAIANMDLNALFGDKQVQEWNRKYFEPLKAEGILVCYVWHASSGEGAWKDYCNRYDYVGMGSDSEISLQKYMQLVNVAKKYNTVVHGMAFTKTALLVRLPLWTVDSTTWIVGQQYGEFNDWDGRKMSRMKKVDWRRKAKTKLLRPPFNADWNLLTKGMGGQGDTYELLRLNIISYMVAEEHIQKRLGTKQYWMTGKKVEAKEVDTSLSWLSKDWFDGDMLDYKEKAAKLNITAEASKEDIVAVMKDFYGFITQDEDFLEDFDEDRLIENFKDITGEEASTGEEALEGLRLYYLDNLTGVRADYLADMEDEGGYRAETRTDMVTEDEDYEIRELSPDELDDIQKALPEPSEMPEVDAYDQFLQKNKLTITRDDTGRFVKGQQLVRKPKQVYSEKYPKLACNTCYKSGDCPKYKANCVCAFDTIFKRFDMRNEADIMEAMGSMVEHNLARMQKAMMFETMDGGMPTGEVTSLLDQNMRLMEKLMQMRAPRSTPLMHHTKVIHADGTMQESTQLNSNPSQGGILSQLVAAMMKDSKPDHHEYDPDAKDQRPSVDVIEVTEYEEVEATGEAPPEPKPKRKLMRKR